MTETPISTINSDSESNRGDSQSRRELKGAQADGNQRDDEHQRAQVNVSAVFASPMDSVALADGAAFATT